MSEQTKYTYRSLEEMSSAALLKLYNDNSTTKVARFSDRTAALRRTAALLGIIPSSIARASDRVVVSEPTKTHRVSASVQNAPATPAVSKERRRLKDPSEYKKREMYFNFPVKDRVLPIKNPNSLRGKLRDRLLQGGAKFEDLLQVTMQWDKENERRGHSVENYMRRTYEGTRLLHYYTGYGMKQHPDGTITLVEGKTK